MNQRAATLLLLAAGLAACSGEAPKKLTPAEAAALRASPEPTEPTLPPDHPPVPASAPAVEDDPEFPTPAGWVREKPASSMRRAQFRLPGEGGAPAAHVVVTRLGSDGGGLEANLTRWGGMFRPDEGASGAHVRHELRTHGGVEIVEVDVAGTYLAQSDPGAPVQGEQAGWRMRMSWVRGPDGSTFVKLIGPAPTVARWESSFRAFVDGSIR